MCACAYQRHLFVALRTEGVQSTDFNYVSMVQAFKLMMIKLGQLFISIANLVLCIKVD